MQWCLFSAKRAHQKRMLLLLLLLLTINWETNFSNIIWSITLNTRKYQGLRHRPISHTTMCLSAPVYILPQTDPMRSSKQKKVFTGARWPIAQECRSDLPSSLFTNALIHHNFTFLQASAMGPQVISRRYNTLHVLTFTAPCHMLAGIFYGITLPISSGMTPTLSSLSVSLSLE